MSRAVALRALLVATLAGVAGCSVLEPRADDSRYFLLRPLADPAGTPALSGLVLGLGPITIPEHLDRSEILSLVGPYELRYATGHRWVEPLGAQISTTLSENLAASLGPEAIVTHPWFESEGVDLQVEIDFTPIRMENDGAWTGAANWVLRDAASRAPLERNRFVYELGRDSIPPDDLARALSEQMRRLSDEIAVGVRARYGRN